MAHRRVRNTTKLEIIHTASRLFIENGYRNTSVRSICNELDMSTGHLMFYFPTKEHLLKILVSELCDFQWKLIQNEINDGNSLLLCICLELMSMAAASEEDPVAKDFLVSAYSSPLTLEIIRKNDTHRAKTVFGKFCPDWNDDDYKAAETLVSGIEYATLMTTPSSATLEKRISSALNTIMMLYNVPEDLRKMKIEKVLSMDYRKIGKRIFKEFRQYIEEVNENAFEELMNK